MRPSLALEETKAQNLSLQVAEKSGSYLDAPRRILDLHGNVVTLQTDQPGVEAA